MTCPLFDDPPQPASAPRVLAPGAMVLPGWAEGMAPVLLGAVQCIVQQAALRHLVTPGGRRMSVAMTNCGRLGWVSDARGYRYSAVDPDSGRPWPAMPAEFVQLAAGAARDAGFAGFVPDACLINRYVPGSRLSLHQDRDERRHDAPIVSVSLGIAAVFVWGGDERSDPVQRVPLLHGDVVVWGGPARLRYHGVLPLPEASHPLTGACRINLTFRTAG